MRGFFMAMDLKVIDTGFFKLDGGAMFGVVPKAIWNKLNPADENNMCTWAMRCLLVETQGRKILIDTGIGSKQSEKFFKNFFLHGESSLLGSLQQHGLSPEDITDVFLTHLHFDHVGGAVTKLSENNFVTTFPNATYWSHKKHWYHATNPNPREKASFLTENLLPLAESGQLRLIEQPEEFPYFPILMVNGHTEAQMLPVLSYKGRAIAYMADLLPSAAHIPVPYVMSYDIQPLMSMQEKEMFLDHALKNDITLFFEHDPVNECATLQYTEKGIRVKETFRLNDL